MVGKYRKHTFLKQTNTGSNLQRADDTKLTSREHVAWEMKKLHETKSHTEETF